MVLFVSVTFKLGLLIFGKGGSLSRACLHTFSEQYRTTKVPG